jgi:hypothetical protein
MEISLALARLIIARRSKLKAEDLVGERMVEKFDPKFHILDSTP